ncbi:MAG TPA: hypothetical protein VF614_02595 [Chthoniobacteraceae bacterium]|jgi:hypothetical protein
MNEDAYDSSSRHVLWSTAYRGGGTLLCAVVVYFLLSPFLWLPFIPTARKGKPLPHAVKTFFRPAGFLFDHFKPYNWLIYYEAQFLGVHDIDYEGRILGSDR